METFIEQILNGLTVGGIYALIALGYTMVYGIIKLINFAHGDIFMVGAFAGYFAVLLVADIFIGQFIASSFGLSADALSGILGTVMKFKFIISMVVSIIFCGFLGFFAERVAYRPLRDGTPKIIIGSAIGLAFIILVAVFGRGGFSLISMFLFLMLVSSLSVSTIAFARYLFNNGKVLKKEDFNRKSFIYAVSYISSSAVIIYLGWYFDILTMILVSLACVLLIYRLVVSRVKSSNSGGNSRINALISAIGMSMIISNMVTLLRGPGRVSYSAGFLQGSFAIGGIRISYLQSFIIIFSFILMALLFYIIHRTKFGLAMRAVSHNLNAARLMGINPDKIIGTTFVLGSSLAGAAGVLVGTYYQIADPNMGMMYGLKAFVAAVLGGIGSIPGAVVGGIVLGIAEVTGIALISSSYKDAIAFGILILILIIKPTGIFGKTMKEKV